MSPWIAAIIALFVWWFSTGAILMAVKYADRAGETARIKTTVFALPLLFGGLYGLHLSATDASLFGVYVAFISALSLWGWIELAFLTGMITGPNTQPLPENISEKQRFASAWGTVAYHELALLSGLVAVCTIAWGAANTFGMWSYIILFAARISAKLNLYLGVRKIQIEFLPTALSHLPSHFRTKSMNVLFPFSVTGLTFAAACWLERLYASETEAQIEGFALLTALTILALFEHWMMVLPIPDERLWRWMLPAQPLTPKPTTTNDTEGGGHHGL